MTLHATCGGDDWYTYPDGRRECRICRRGSKTAYRKRQGPALYLWENARHRAKKQGVPFSIRVSDIEIPATCPVLGIPLAVAPGTGPRGPTEHSPSLDKLRPELGYAKGNIVVISHRANMLKNTGTCAEFEALLGWMRSHNLT